MTVVYHPEFPRDIVRHAAHYAAISSRLETRFLSEVNQALAMVVADPGVGHFVNAGSQVIRSIRRWNLRVFPFFVLYGLTDDQLVFGSLIPSASDPLMWLRRLRHEDTET